MPIPYRGPEDIVDTPELRDTFNERFPHADYSPEAVELAKVTIGIASLVEKLKTIERIPQGADGRRENLAEHSFMVALMALEAAKIHDVEVDTGKMFAYALCHDLLEVMTGDTNTFAQTDEERAEKEHREAKALDTLDGQLPPEAMNYLKAYEMGVDFEARFVRAVDKLAPQAVNYAGHMRIISDDLGLHDYDPEILVAFHDRRNKDYFNRFGGDFPTIVAAHGLESILLEEKLKKERDTLRQAETERSPTETERKFLFDLSDLPETIDLLNLEMKKQHTKQFYVEPKEQGSETRIRSIDDTTYEQTIKSAGTIQRKETTPRLDLMDQEVFELAYRKKGIGNMIDKTRHFIPLEDGLVAELDVFHGALEGLVTVEVEFKGRDALMKAQTWQPPTWFGGREVTDDDRFKNKNLAGVDDVSELLGSAR